MKHFLWLLSTFLLFSCQKEKGYENQLKTQNFKIVSTDENGGLSKIAFILSNKSSSVRKTSYYIEFIIPTNGIYKPNFRDVFTVESGISNANFDIEFPKVFTASEVKSIKANIIELKEVCTLSDVIQPNLSFNNKKARYPEYAKSVW